MCLFGLCLSVFFIYFLFSNGLLSNTDQDHTHCPLFNTQEVGGTGPASYLWAAAQWGRQRTYCTDTASVRRSVVCLLHAKSSGAVMRLFLAFVIFVCGVGFIGCKLSSKCPSGQFMSKNQCVLCHPTCSECSGHELFECTTCGVGEPFLPVLSA